MERYRELINELYCRMEQGTTLKRVFKLTEMIGQELKVVGKLQHDELLWYRPRLGDWIVRYCDPNKGFYRIGTFNDLVQHFW